MPLEAKIVYDNLLCSSAANHTWHTYGNEFSKIYRKLILKALCTVAAKIFSKTIRKLKHKTKVINWFKLMSQVWAIYLEDVSWSRTLSVHITDWAFYNTSQSAEKKTLFLEKFCNFSDCSFVGCYFIVNNKLEHHCKFKNSKLFYPFLKRITKLNLQIGLKLSK